jgi:hypothetical protein
MSTGTSPADGRQAMNEAQEAAQNLTGQAQEKAGQAAEQAKGRLKEQLDQRSSQAATQIGDQASDLRAVSQTLREQGKSGPAQVADRLASYAERAEEYLRDKDSDALLADAEDFGRRQPWAVGAGALALGFAASRFLKASSSQRLASRGSSAASSPPPAPETLSAPVARPPIPAQPVQTPPVPPAADPLRTPVPFGSSEV